MKRECRSDCLFDADEIHEAAPWMNALGVNYFRGNLGAYSLDVNYFLMARLEGSGLVAGKKRQQSTGALPEVCP